MLNVKGYLDTIKLKLHLWVMGFAGSRYATWWLAAFAFAEGTFFMVPPEILLIAILSAGKERWLYYTFIATVASVLGAIAGYGVGLFLFDLVGVKIVELYSLQDELELATRLFADNAFITMLVAAFTPIPDKIFNLTAGLLRIDFMTFVVAIAIGRGARFLIVAYVMKKFGKPMGEFIFKRFNQLSLIGGVLIIVGLIYLYFR